MSTGPHPRISEVLPNETWDALEQDKNAVLVDVRTQAEWGFVGVPDLGSLGRSAVFVEWASYPGMSQNPHFVESVLEAMEGKIPSRIFFLCRSGVRSLHAAHAVASALSAQDHDVECINVIGGFEGDLDAEGQRGRKNGWKVSGLAWRQT